MVFGAGTGPDRVLFAGPGEEVKPMVFRVCFEASAAGLAGFDDFPPQVCRGRLGGLTDGVTGSMGFLEERTGPY